MRDYRHEYDTYQGKPEQIKHRAERNHARLEETKKLGHAPRGDVGHIHPLQRGGSNTSSNERVQTVAQNRSWRKGQKGYYVPTLRE
jgi:hypothetical protein